MASISIRCPSCSATEGVVRNGKSTAGPQRVCASVSYQQLHGFSAEQLRNATHLVWATGGGMVPEEEMNQYLAKGR